MRLELTDILGLTIGFTVGGVVFGLILLHLPQAQPPPVRPETGEIRPAATPPPVRPPSSAARAAVIPAASVTSPIAAAPPAVPPRAAPLPSVIRPGDPGDRGDRAGTGFFVTTDGLIMTAAHVVDGCRRTEILAPGIAPTEARVLARDTALDLALLRVPARWPWTLWPSEAAAAAERFTVYGYPADGDPVRPTATGARAHPRPRAGPPAGLWIESDRVRPGFSGGPIVAEDGSAAGLVQGGLVGPTADAIPLGVAFGPDAAALAAFLWREASRSAPDHGPERVAGGPEAARNAVVHVICRR